MKTPEYLHITKAGQKAQRKIAREDGEKGFGLNGQSGVKKYAVPINYFVTVWAVVEARDDDEAILKAQEVEAPPIWVEGFHEQDMQVETEVVAYEVLEVE